jgi:hypothetical protein
MRYIRAKKFFFIILFTTLTSISFGQGRQADSLAKLVTEMARHNVYEASYTVGYGGVVSKQYQRFEALTALATEQQLLFLAEKNKNAVVRIYAFQALKRKGAIPEQLKVQFSNDKTIVRILSGCFGDDKPLNVLFEQELKSPLDLPK